MNVTLLSKPEETINILYTACRTCYSSDTPMEIWEKAYNIPIEQKVTLINDIISSGHHSILEHTSFTFAISGISRVTSHQLVRHRLISPSQQSQRYVQTTKDTFSYAIPEEIKELGLEDLYRECMIDSLLDYQDLIKMGVKKENARMLMPEGSTTNMVITMNLRELIHICNVRLCKRAQEEITELTRRIAEQIRTVYPMFSKYLVPKCRVLGYCSENRNRTCGEFPLKEEVLEAYRQVSCARENANENSTRTEQGTE